MTVGRRETEHDERGGCEISPLQIVEDGNREAVIV